ncbi:MAG: flagellar biosynthesis anti-sigma factor FlgM [Porphyrobacter sp.]|jgi:negative regulator of flagellin synthesis FlgM|nr:flagellar biosynthesis anti-sigma factor FlgM [Porphyrobacter sp.]
MPSVELSKLSAIGAARALTESDRSQAAARAASTAAQPVGGGPSARPGIAVEIGGAAASDLTSPPVDSARVAEIRSALRDGTYPLVPTKIADAMIAAQVSFAVLPRDER